ncbi:MAG: sensor histidine kinase [Ferruginibacter sp.]|nr:sensor histidine kinase [Cytophagales bacterium]
MLPRVAGLIQSFFRWPPRAPVPAYLSVVFSRRNQWLLHLVFWLSEFSLIVYAFSQVLPFELFIDRVGISTLLHLVFAYANWFYFVPRFFLAHRYGLYFVATLLWLATLVFVRAYLDNWLGLGRLFANVPLFSFFHFGMVTFPFLIMWTVSSLGKLLDEWVKKVYLESKLKNSQLEAELRWLKMQINPHFLFNALNNLYTLVYLKSDQAAPTLLKLSGMLRYMLHEGEAAKVTIHQEIAYIQDYIDLQQLKMEERPSISFQVDHPAPGPLIEPMLFINFIENSFKHGNLDDPRGWVKLGLRVRPEKVEFWIENSILPGQTTKDKRGGIGLENVRQRLALLYPNRHLLQIISQDNVYKVRLTLLMQP